MAYVPCHACGLMHKNIPQDDIVKVIDAFQAGNGQVVTKNGIETICILDILETPEHLRNRKMNLHGKQLTSSERSTAHRALYAAVSGDILPDVLYIG